MKPKANKWHLMWALFKIYSSKICPRCFSKSPYYNDCPVCSGYVVGCEKLSLLDCFLIYLSWLKEDNNLE